MEQYRSATIRPDLTTIVVIGDVTAEDARAVIEKWFGDWEAVGPKPNTSLPAVPLNKPSARNVIDPDQMQDSVVLTEQLKLNRLDPGYYPLQLGTYVLGGGFYATRLYHDLRKMTGYVYSVDVSLNASNTRASYSVSYACSPENVSKARALIEHDINQMRTEDISAGKLTSGKGNPVAANPPAANRAKKYLLKVCWIAPRSDCRLMSRSVRPGDTLNSTHKT